MPIRRFKMLSQNVDRIEAAKDRRQFNASASLNSAETAESFVDACNKMVGIVYDIEEGPAELQSTEELDREGLEDLKTMGSMV